MFRGNVKHTGLSIYDTSGNFGELKWKMKTGGEIYSSPAIDDEGNIYFTCYYDGHLYAVSPTGKIEWRVDLGDLRSISSPAIADDGTIYVGAGDFLHSISREGTVKWSLQLRVSSSPTIGMDGTVYVTAEYSNVVAVNPNGTMKWRLEIGVTTQSSISIADDGTLFVKATSSDPGSWAPIEFLYALTPDGTQMWRRPITQNPTVTVVTAFSSPAIGKNGTIYIGSDDSYLHAFSPQGELQWRFKAEGAIVASPAIGQDGTIYIGNWINTTSDKMPEHSYLYAVNPDGSLKWKFETGIPISCSPSIGADGTVFFGSDNYSSASSRRGGQAHFYALGADGRLKWEIETGSVLSSPAIGKDGSVYFGSVDGYFYAVKGGNPPHGPQILLPIVGMMLLAIVFSLIVLEGNRRDN
jgi:outer membrane protein assembly factor BamB